MTGQDSHSPPLFSKLHVTAIRVCNNTPKTVANFLQFLVGVTASDLQQSPPQRDRDRVRSVVRAEFLHQILDMKINRVL